MLLMDEVNAEYYKDYPHRIDRPIPVLDLIPILLRVLDVRLAGKIDRLPPAYAEGAEPQRSAMSRGGLEFE